MKLLSAIFVCIALFVPVFAAPMQVENLNRGLIAIRVGSGYYLSWRLLGNEAYNTGFNVYRGTTKLTAIPITGATIYTDASGALNSVYTVRAVVGGVEQAASAQALLINNTDGPNSNNTSGESAGYIQIDLKRPADGANGGNYSPGDGSVGDLDGDGVYEIVLKWDPSNAQDNSNGGTTDNVFLDAYKLNGTHMWRIDLGQNIRAGAHYTQFLVYDFDGDGKAELMVKTAPGTKDGTGAYIKMGPAANASHTTAYRNSSGYVLDGPEYITVFDGQTGKELATADYWPARGTVNSWGDNYGNRVDRFNAAVAYVDGERPTAIFQRGYYTRMTFAAWDWRNGQLTRRWTFDSGTSGNSGYAGQGNHQLSVADVNNSGRHSIITGASVIGPDGTGLHTTGKGHGDALHVTHMIKGTATPQIYMPQESGDLGVSLRHANNGNIIFSKNNTADVGRGSAAELDPAVPGFKFWASSGMGLYDLAGNVVSSTLPNNGNSTAVCNFVIWWDGDLARELLDQNQITKWSIANNKGTRMLTAYGSSSVNGTKSNPVVQADLFGDWREEVIWAYGTSALRIYTTTSTTTHRLPTLMHDPVYRVAVAWQNSSYNQPPHPGYYIASDMNFPPPVLNVAVVAGSSSSSVTSSSSSSVPSSSSVAPSSSSSSVSFASIGSGEFIDNLITYDVANAASWSIGSDLNVGAKAYGDRAYLVTSVSAKLQGAEWISSSMVTRLLTLPVEIIQFEMKKDAIVYVLYEDRVDPKPSWLSEDGFSETEFTASVNDNQVDRQFTVYSKSVSEGDVVILGINSNNGTNQSLMYLVAFADPPITGIMSRTPQLNSNTAVGIYNLKGNKVATVSDMSQIANISLPNGVYFAKVRGRQPVKFIVR